MLLQAHLDECNTPSASGGIQLGDAPPADRQNSHEEVEQSASQPVEIEPSPSDHAFEPAAQVHPSPSDSAASDNSADVPLVEESEHQPSNEGCSVQVSQDPMELVENSQFSHRAVSQPITCSLNPPMGNIGMNFPDLRTVSEASEFNNHPTQAMPAVVSWVGPPLCPDPLQKELERFCQEFDLTHKSHEDMVGFNLQNAFL